MEKYVELKSPFTGGKVKEVSTVEEHEFRKEFFSVHVRYYVCEDTGEKFTTSEQDELLFNELYSQYRVNHGIPFPEEIKAIRQRYGLNYQQMTKILGFGTNQYAQYEKGQVPSESNGKMLSAAMNSQFMLHLLEDSKAEFSEEEYNKVYQSVLASEARPESEVQKRLIFRDIRRSIYNGFGVLSVRKVSEMVKFFISHEGGYLPHQTEQGDVLCRLPALQTIWSVHQRPAISGHSIRACSCTLRYHLRQHRRNQQGSRHFTQHGKYPSYLRWL